MNIFIKVLLVILVALACYFIRSILSYEEKIKQINDQLKEAPKNQDHYIFTENGAIRTTYDYDS